MKKAILVALVAMLASSASATLLLYEGFDYTPAVGGLNSGSANGGTGFAAGSSWATDWTATAANVTAGSLSYGYLTTTGNKGATVAGATSGAQSSSMTRNILALPTGVDLWMSFLVNIDTTQDPGFGQWFGFEWGSGGTYAGKSGVSDDLVLGANPAGPPQNSGIAVTAGTHLIVVQYLRLRTGNYDVSMFIDPGTGTLGGAGPGMAASATQANVSIPATRLAFSGPAVGSFDEYRVGESYADVTPIPEPASILLLVSGLVGAYKLRRRS
jgi:hypothetical protein